MMAERQDLYTLFSLERSMQLVNEAMKDDRDEPENFIRMLLLLYDHTKDRPLRDALFNLMAAAYDLSAAHTSAFDAYLDHLRGRQPEGAPRCAARPESLSFMQPESPIDAGGVCG